MTHRTKSATYVNSYKSVGWNTKKYSSEKIKNGGSPLGPRHEGIRRKMYEKNRDTVSKVTV
jgi:hypothetical protein